MRIIIVLSVFLIGCMSEVALFDDYYIEKNLGKCFILKKESFVYETKCTDVEKLSDNTSSCLGIQSFGMEVKGKILSSYNQYLLEEEFWSEELVNVRYGVFSKDKRILYEIPAGTELKIIRIGRVFRPMAGPDWSIIAKANGVEVALPSESPHMGPYWISLRSHFSDNVEFVEGFLEKIACEQ